jgi:DNA-binding beta-propeller fold protein YncE
LTFRSIQIEKGTPGYAAVNPSTNRIYISYSHSDFILIVNLTNGLIEGKISANSPGNIVVNQKTNKIHVSSDDGIYEIDALTNKSEVHEFWSTIF